MERDTIFLTHHTLDTLAFLAAVRRVLDTTDTERVVAATYSPVVECWLSRQKHPRLTVEYASKRPQVDGLFNLTSPRGGSLGIVIRSHRCWSAKLHGAGCSFL